MVNDTDSVPCFSNDTDMAKQDISMIILATMLSAINGFILLANSVMIVSLTRSLYSDKRAGKESSISKALMLSMASSDLILGTFTIPLGVYELINHWQWYIGFRICAARVIIDVYVSTVSIFHVAFMAVDRYLAVCRPLLHRTLTLRTGFIMASCSWALPATVITCLLIFNNNGLEMAGTNTCPRRRPVCVYQVNVVFHTVTSVIFIHVPVIFVFIIYVIILRAIRQFQSRKLKFALKGRTNLAEHGANTVVGSSPATHNNGGWCWPISGNLFQCGSSRSVHRQCLQLSTFVEVVSVKAVPISQVSLSPETHSSSNSPFTKCKTVITTSEPDLEPSENSKRRQTSPTTIDAHNALDYEGTGAATVSVPGIHQHVETAAAPRKQNIKAVRTVGFIIVCFTVCWMPIGWLLLLHNLINVPVPQRLVQLCAWLGYLSSALNPVVYCSNTSVRQAVLSLICSYSRRR